MSETGLRFKSTLLKLKSANHSWSCKTCGRMYLRASLRVHRAFDQRLAVRLI